jgi:hypothetical protein
MNFIVRLTESDLQLEYLWTLTNEVSPQQTIVPDPITLELAIPDNAADLKVENLSRPEPADMPIRAGSRGGWAGVAVPFPPGQTRLRMTARLPYSGQARIPVSANLALEQWSVLAFPPDLKVEGEGLAQVKTEDQSEYQRFRGPILAAGASLMLNISGGTGPRITSTAPAQVDSETGVEEEHGATSESRSFQVPWVVIFLVLVIVYVILRLRRRA